MRKSRLNDYRLEFTEILGFRWRDKRDDTGTIYERYFPNAYELKVYLEEYFGTRVAKRVWRENSDKLP